MIIMAKERDTVAHPVSDEEILNKVQEYRRRGSNDSCDQYDRMRKSEDFVIGEQWAPEVRAQAESDGRFTLTIPVIKPQINQISGAEIQNPQDFIIRNTQESAATTARILTALVKQVADTEHARFEKSGVFRSGISSGQGCFGLFVDKVTDPKHANLTLRKLNEHHVLFDSNAESYDINRAGTGCEYVIYDEPVPKYELEQEYPKKKDELVSGGSSSAWGTTIGFVRGIIDWQLNRRNRSNNSYGCFGSRPRTGEDTLEKTRYWKTHTWWKEYKTCIHWYDNRKSELDSMFLCRDEEIKAAKKITKEAEEAAKINAAALTEQMLQQGIDPNIPDAQQAIQAAGTPAFSIEEVDSFIMHHTITSRDVFLEDRKDEFKGVQMFPVVPFWPYHINGYKSGIAEDLIGTQEEINWTHSMALNQVKQESYPPVLITDDSSGNKKDELRDILQGPGRAVIDKSDYGGDVEFANQPQLPTAEVFTQQAMTNVKIITGRLDVPDRDDRSLSGRAKLVDVQKTQQGSMSVFTNYNYTLSILGNLIVDVIRKNDIFSEDEIVATVDGDDLIDEELFAAAKQIVLQQIEQAGGQIPDPPEQPDPVLARSATPEIQSRMLQVFQDEMKVYEEFVNGVEEAAKPIAQDLLLGLIKNMKIGKYNTTMTMSPMSETMRAIKAEETFELNKVLLDSGDVGLDGDDLIEATDVPNKEKLRAGREKKMAQIREAEPSVSVSRSA